MNHSPVRRALSVLLVAGLTGGLAGMLPAQQAQPDAPAANAATTLAPAPLDLWSVARAGDMARLEQVMTELADATAQAPDGTGPAALNNSLAALQASIDKREKLRAEKIAEVDQKLAEKLAADDGGHEALSEALKLAVERYIVSTNKDGFKTEPHIAELIQRADSAARAAEGRGDWFTANELFWRLQLLLEEEGTYRPDTKRLGQRLSMIRLYTPERFWELRNRERKASGKSDLPPYNGLGENYNDKLAGVTAGMVKNGLFAASRGHIERIPLREMMLGGIDAVRTMVTTSDLEATFAGLKNPAATDAIKSFLNEWTTRLKDPNPASPLLPQHLSDFVDDLVATNRTSVALPDGAILHEFGNGAMSRLDEYSAIIWPDEVSRFNRMTEGKFRGVGVQIQMDDESQMIKVVTPLDGTPAMRAGVKSGDMIKKIDGKSAIGISLNQAVDLITGPEGTPVTVTIERETGNKDHDGKKFTEEIDFRLVRAVIKQHSVKGWERNGPRETDWDYFIDKERGIGYLRLTQFTDQTTEELRGAIARMKRSGLNGMILDLRYNPGGLLTEAVSVANTFIDAGVIVSTEGNGMVEPPRSADPGQSMLGTTPLVVLINQGSASASEIVAGAIRHYADKGEVNAVVLGERSFGKGSVQNVWNLSPSSKMKLTTQYYKLPDGRVIHRKPGAGEWGVEPNLTVSMLPEQESDGLNLRRDLDVLPIDATGNVVESTTPRQSPQKIIDDGLDIQLETALVLLRGKSLAIKEQAAREPATTRQ